MMCCKTSQTVICLLVTIGALNWGLVGIGHFANMNLNVVNLLLGTWPMVEYIVYLLVGVAGVAKIAKTFMGGCCQGGACAVK